MKAPTNGCSPNPEEGEKKSINSELWHACAGPLVSLPPVGSLVVYFPQGHSEQVAASMQKQTDCIPSYPNLPSKLICMLHNVTLHADSETDEVYAQMTLQPVNKFDREAMIASDIGLKHNRQPAEFFCKTLTASDTSTHGGFSVPRRAAEKIFPPLDFSLQPPAQELVAKDLHDCSWTFRHIYRGQPKRHLLTTGWSVFVSTKRLLAGDAVLFIRDEKSQLMLGLRRANRQQPALSSSVISSDSMHIGILAAAAHAAANNSAFNIFYNPRASPSEFVIPLAKYNKAMYAQVSPGMRFRMMFETEESGVRRYMGTVTSVSDLDPVRWKGSQWRNLQVGWDESTAGERPSRVSIWDIEPVVTPFYICPPYFRPKFPKQAGFADDGSDMENAFKRGMPWIGDDFGMNDAASSLFPGLSLVQWMNMQQNNQFPAPQSGFYPSMISSVNTDDPSKLMNFQAPMLSNAPVQFHQTPLAWSHQPPQQQHLSQPPQQPTQQELLMKQQLQQNQQQHMQQALFQQGYSTVPQNQSRDQIVQHSVQLREQQVQLLPENITVPQNQSRHQIVQQSVSAQQVQLLPDNTQSVNGGTIHAEEVSSQQKMEQKPTMLQKRHQQVQTQFDQSQVHSSQQILPNSPEQLAHSVQRLPQRLVEKHQDHLLQQQPQHKKLLLQQPQPQLQQQQQQQLQHQPSQLQQQQCQQQKTQPSPPQNQYQQPIPYQQLHLISQQQQRLDKNSLSAPSNVLPQNFHMSQFQSSPQRPHTVIKGQSSHSGDAPLCSISPSTNDYKIFPENFSNINQNEQSIFVRDSASELSNNNLVQELQNKPGMCTANEISTLRIPGQLKYKGVVPDQLEGCSSATPYCFETDSLQQNISIPTSIDRDIQSHQQNNLAFAIDNGHLKPDTLLSRGFDSLKDPHILLSNYGDGPRDMETELLTAAIPINDPSFGVADLSFKAGSTSDIALNANGMWANQAQLTRTYTKVQKRGSVGRSIDVTRYKGYDELRQDLAHMFGIEGQLNDPHRTDWKLVYVDHENDILLIGDDPWDEFISCVQCIKILSSVEVQQMSLDGDLGQVPSLNPACSGTDSGNIWQGNCNDHSAPSFNK